MVCQMADTVRRGAEAAASVRGVHGGGFGEGNAKRGKRADAHGDCA